jgi:hypothetical protein
VRSRFKPACALVAALAALVLVAEIALALRGTGEDERVQLVLDTWVDADYCIGVVVPSSAPDSSWPHAALDELVQCGHAGPGPGVRYARFASGAQLREDLLADPPAGQVCIAGREVLVDFLDGGQFAPLCRRFHGVVVTGKRQGLRRFWHLD